jgi:hypothetical protein
MASRRSLTAPSACDLRPHCCARVPLSERAISTKTRREAPPACYPPRTEVPQRDIGPVEWVLRCGDLDVVLTGEGKEFAGGVQEGSGRTARHTEPFGPKAKHAGDLALRWSANQSHPGGRP